ncbi:class A beta-lactamase [Candidatus Kirkpatrickella diaphorinae]|uniref:Beta-lactamase n=1 Tax=Candidatus Kirkpatrickella diaphorinae TaxID=2984322 RepID=A0ABY6GJ62_9PROT|nr:class A beta-lactamase [Candidatus Kirkpatrickella diaphorinae]UYH51562.1 class A beta-lactamase [Candidatus Kirkpatrickella diaphorinae]
MSHRSTRREILASGISAVLAPRAFGAEIADFSGARDIDALQKRTGGRIGFSARLHGERRMLAFQPDQLFPMCSTHKFISVAALLALVDSGKRDLRQFIRYTERDIQFYAPVAKRHLHEGGMSLNAICAAAFRQSDNSAANLILQELGGPAGWTRFARQINDPVSRLDRYEPALNAAEAGDERDTTSPEAMRRNIEKILTGNVLSRPSRRRLTYWMRNAPLTSSLIQSGLGRKADVYDKSGAGAHGTRGDIGLVNLRDGTMMSVAIYLTGTTLSRRAQDRLIAEITRRIVRQFFPT